ncbi:MAG: hypothetical protein ACE5GE_04630 [Phycisphaerae bacterium]
MNALSRTLLSGCLLAFAAVLHLACFDWSYKTRWTGFDGLERVSAFGIWPTQHLTVSATVLLGLVLPVALIALAVYLTRNTFHWSQRLQNLISPPDAAA